MENKGNFIEEAENPGGNDWDMKNLFFILFYTRELLETNKVKFVKA